MKLNMETYWPTACVETAVRRTPVKKPKINEISEIDPQTLHFQDLTGAIHSRVAVEKFAQPLILILMITETIQ